MKTCKKLLAITIALALFVTTLVSGLVVSAATPGSLTVAETTTVEVGEQAIVNFNINFGETPVNALHMLATITSDLAIVDAELGAVTYPNGEPVVDGELESPALRLDTKNLEAGKILFESGVDGAVTVTDVNFTVTFAAAETAGDYAFAINVESTDYDEADFDAMTAAGTITVAAPHECVAGEAIDNGDGTHDVPCTGCDVLIKDNEPHNFVDGACDVCGAAEPVTGPVVDENIAMAITLNITNTINMRYIASNLPACDDFYVEFSSYRCDTSYNFGTEKETNQYYKNDTDKVTAASGGRYVMYFSGLGMYELNIPVTAKVYCLDANDNVIFVSKEFTTTVAQKAKDAIPTLTNAKTKTMYSDIVVMAAEAQTYFVNGKDCDLADIPLATEGFTGGTPTADFDKSILDQTNTGGAIGNSGVTVVTALNLAGNPTPRYTISGASGAANFRAVASYNSPKLGEVNYEFTVENVTHASNGRYVAYFTGVALYDTNQPITLTVYDGETELYSGLYSIECAAYNSIGTTNRNAALYNAIAKFGISSRDYFGI